MELLNSWRESAAVPAHWRPAPPPGAVAKVPVKNTLVLRLLRRAVPYFEHASGRVAFVKHVIRHP